jgi:hypothetical protein
MGTSSTEDLPTKTILDEHLPGYGELYQRLKSEGREPGDINQALEREGRNAEIGLKAARGIPSPLKDIVDFLRGRRFVKDLGVHPVDVVWLEFHVPRSCSGALKWNSSGSEECSFSLNVVGSGLGSGRRIAWSMQSDIAARSICMKFIQKLDVRVRLYETAGGNGFEPAVDVVAARGRQLVAWADCPHCSSTIESVDDFEFQKGQMIDLRAYDSKYAETFTRDLAQPVNANLSIGLPAIAAVLPSANLGISFKREAKLSCSLVYEFAKGRCYQPYWPVDYPSNLPYWSST